jgi:oligoendopeptidase F
MLFQERDIELLGLTNAHADAASEALGALWATAEIAAVSLVDMKAWHWLYEHPDATPSQLREAVLACAREVWNRYYAPLFGQKDIEILAIYSHTVTNPLYLPDYPLGHIIAFQLAEKVRGPRFGTEFERIARQGRLTPDAWMKGAVGHPISARALLAAARSALAATGR